MTPDLQLRTLQKLNQSLVARDDVLREEAFAGGEELMVDGAQTVEQRLEEESIILRRLRPVLAIHENQLQLKFREREDSEVWKNRLAHVPALGDVLRAVGRIELVNHRKPWVGTGWLVQDDVLVTNRHVANEFIAKKGDVLSFMPGVAGGASGAKVDFLKEIDNDRTLLFRITEALHVEPKDGLDLAFFRVELRAGDSQLAKPIKLSSTAPRKDANVAVIGYPALDPRIPEPELMLKIFDNVFEKKRLAPGLIMHAEARFIQHDCSTLGGNSGSVVVDLETGEAVGLHFKGGFLVANLAVRADAVGDRLSTLGRAQSRSRAFVPREERVNAGRANGSTLRAAGGSSGHVTFTIPLTVSVSLGRAATPSSVRVDAYPPPALTSPEVDTGAEEEEEGPAEDLSGREGYDEDFLGDSSRVRLPTVVRAKADVVRFEVDGKQETILRYQHFSVVMNKKRRMCFFSACNIDGSRSKKTKRSTWRFDRRIPQELQIKDECYGSPPKFSRGHMTRREDPAWGTPSQANQGNSDSMFVTNAVPQMQAFNSPIWLGLEDYALQHAREDDMLISVITGPYFKNNDPVLFGVKVPTSFWKVIAFIHDETGELCATGYEMTDEDVGEEFVFGDFVSPQLKRTTQVSIASIAKKAGLSFHDLSAVDAFEDGGEESLFQPAALTSLEQIRFVK